MMKRWKWLVSGLVLVCVVYWALPWIYVGAIPLLPKNGEGNEEASRAHAERLASLGDRAIPAILYSLRTHSPWARRYCYLPVALKQIGPPAQQALRQAIDEERDPEARAHLISSLVSAFGDPSRLARWARDIQENQVSTWTMGHMDASVKWHVAGAPRIIAADREHLDPAFLAWLEHRP